MPRLFKALYIFCIVGIFVLLGLLWFLFSLGGMPKVTAWYLFQIMPPAAGLLTLLLVLIGSVFTHRFSRASMNTVLIALASISPALLMVLPVTYPAALSEMSPSATVRLPAGVPLKVAWGGDKVSVNYHAMAPDQRWAYDLAVEPCFTGSKKLEEYGAYGLEIVAPASGVIAAAHDGEPDAPPGTLSNNYTTPFGNYLAIKLRSQTYLIIAHLQPGSLLTKEGDKVTEGQPLAKCGNSGNTSEPHIHIHHQRQNPKGQPANFAEGLPLFFRDHDGPAMPTGGFKVVSGVAIPIGPLVRHTGR